MTITRPGKARQSRGKKQLYLLFGFLIASLTAILGAEPPTPTAAVSPSSASEPDSVDKDAKSGPQPRIRFLDLGADLRFNYMDLEDGGVADRGLQYRLHARLQADLRKDGSTYIAVRAETGKAFDNAWNNTSYGLGPTQSNFNIKSIMLHQKLGERFALEVGGLDFEQGAGSDATYASDDGYMTGYRLRYDGSSAALPVKLALTAAYLGDFDRQSFFSRARMNRLNYVQLLAEREITEILHVSGEVDSMHDVVYGRGALRLNRLWIFDEPMLEAVVRATDRASLAWSASVSRRWSHDSHWRTELIFADLPDNFYELRGQRFLLNREEIDIGKRLAIGMAYRLTHDLEFTTFAGRLLDRSESKRWIAQMGVSYQFAGFVNRFMR